MKLTSKSQIKFSSGAWVIASLIIFLAGCGGAYDASVKGTVTYDGKPLDRGTVTFHPSGGGAAAYGKIAEDGTFKMQTGDERGLAVGDYKVTVQSIEQIPAASPQDPPGAKELIPSKYKSPTLSGISYTVTAGSSEFNIELPKE